MLRYSPIHSGRPAKSELRLAIARSLGCSLSVGESELQRYIAARLLQGAVAVLAVTVIVFFLARLTGDPRDILLTPDVTKEEYDRVGRELGLDKPVVVQYLLFLGNLAKGDLGNSIQLRTPVTTAIWSRLPATLQLGLLSAVISILIALPIGVVSAMKRDTWTDKVGKAVAVLGQSVPNFWLGIVLMQVFGVWLGVLPVAGRGGPEHLVLPAVTLGWYMVAGLMRLMRSGMLDVLDSEYIKLARVKGLPERTVVAKHALKNALIPVLSFAGPIFVVMLAGTVVVETVFAWPGTGRLAYQAVVWRDFPLTQGIVLLYSLMFIMVNLLTDVAYAYLDPRIKYDGHEN